MTYNTQEQIKIISSCKTAVELLETKEILEEIQETDVITQKVYDTKMKFLLSKIKVK